MEYVSGLFVIVVMLFLFTGCASTEEKKKDAQAHVEQFEAVLEGKTEEEQIRRLQDCLWPGGSRELKTACSRFAVGRLVKLSHRDDAKGVLREIAYGDRITYSGREIARSAVSEFDDVEFDAYEKYPRPRNKPNISTTDPSKVSAASRPESAYREGKSFSAHTIYTSCDFNITSYLDKLEAAKGKTLAEYIIPQCALTPPHYASDDIRASTLLDPSPFYKVIYSEARDNEKIWKIYLRVDNENMSRIKAILQTDKSSGIVKKVNIRSK